MKLINNNYFPTKSTMSKNTSFIKQYAIKLGYRYFDFTWENIISLPRKRKKLMKKLAIKYYKPF